MQFSNFFFKSKDSLIQLIENGEFKKIEEILVSVEIHSYWKTHSSFYKKVKERELNIGKSFVRHLMLNSIYPLYFHLNNKLKNHDVSEDLYLLYAKTHKERNRILKSMEDSGFKNENGLYSQALLQLDKNYCQSKKCLNCAIGNKILSENNTKNTVIL